MEGLFNLELAAPLFLKALAELDDQTALAVKQTK
jgi:hypothetical protein